MAPACYGQAVAVAEVQGQVLDVGGSAVPGAQVKMIQTETDYVRTTTAGVDGAYSLPNLPVGPYMLEVRADGFKTHVQSGIILQVGSGVQINVTLQVGSVTENVRVTASAHMAETRNSSAAHATDQPRIRERPLHGPQA